MFKKVAVTVCIILAAAYVGISVFFMSHFAFNTKVNDINASMKSVDGLKKAVEKEADGYVLTITGREGLTDTVKASEIDLKPQFDDSFDKIKKSQNGFAWPVSLFRKTAISSDTVVSYSDEKLGVKIKTLKFMNPDNERKPADAYLSDYKDNGYSIIPEDNGTTVDESVFTKAVDKALLSLSETLDLDAAGAYKNAEITSEDPALNELAANLNKCVQSKITFTFGDSVETLEGSTIKDWITVSGNNSVSVDMAKTREYVNALAKKYDTFGQPRQFHTTAGDTITITGGAYGWWTDRPATAEALADAIMQGKSGNLDVVYKAKAAQYGDNDIGNSYVEINTGAQHLYVYKDGQMAFESDFVSGCLFKGNSTPDGIYGITYKEKDATLVGENYSSDVSYWMPFNGNIGMHDATWRNSFGGHIYYTSGSHGCVNLPVSSAKTIFSLVEKGEPVIVYGGITKDMAVNTLSDAEKLQYMAKGYIPMTPEVALALQQAAAASQAAAQ